MNRTPPTLDEILLKLDNLADPAVKASQEQLWHPGGSSLGISLYTLRDLAKGIRDHQLALALWDTGIHEARMLAAMIEEPEKATMQQLKSGSRISTAGIFATSPLTRSLFIPPLFLIESMPGQRAKRNLSNGLHSPGSPPWRFTARIFRMTMKSLPCLH